tara:strand:+ start:41 stop:616 length:576 start_codon:yes stop_codon:yes gene_type:complete
MKTFKQFQEETQQLDEALPAVIPLALKLGGMALSAYSAGSALNNLRKGKYKQAAFDALGAIPGGRAFKIAKGLGASKNLARGASALQSASRWNMTGLTPNAYAKGVDKVFDTGIKAVSTPFKGNKTNKPNQPGSGAKPDLTKEKPNKYAGKTFKTVTTSMKLGGDKKKNIVKGGGKVGDAVNKVAKDMAKK